jgi:thioredoxin 1
VEFLSDADFDGGRIRRDGPVLVMFYADWCGFCRRFLPKFEAFAKVAPFPCVIADASDEDSALWETFSIKIVPTVVAFKDGVPVGRKDGRRGLGLSEDDLRFAASTLPA